MQIIDADGHVNDRPCMHEISKYMPAGKRTEVFAAFDHILFHYLEGGDRRSRTGTVGPKEWVSFLDEEAEKLGWQHGAGHAQLFDRPIQLCAGGLGVFID